MLDILRDDPGGMGAEHAEEVTHSGGGSALWARARPILHHTRWPARSPSLATRGAGVPAQVADKLGTPGS